MLAFFFIFSSLVNLDVAYTFSEEFLDEFRLFGMLGLMIVFVIIHVFYLTDSTKEQAAIEKTQTKQDNECRKNVS